MVRAIKGRGDILPMRAKLMKLQCDNLYYCDICGEANSQLYDSWFIVKKT